MLFIENVLFNNFWYSRLINISRSFFLLFSLNQTWKIKLCFHVELKILKKYLFSGSLISKIPFLPICFCKKGLFLFNSKKVHIWYFRSVSHRNVAWKCLWKLIVCIKIITLLQSWNSYYNFILLSYVNIVHGISFWISDV